VITQRGTKGVLAGGSSLEPRILSTEARESDRELGRAHAGPTQSSAKAILRRILKFARELDILSQEGWNQLQREN